MLIPLAIVLKVFVHPVVTRRYNTF